MKYPRITLELTVADSNPRTRISDAKLRLKEWVSLQEDRGGDMASKHIVHHRSTGAQRIALSLLLSAGLCLISSKLMAQEAIVTPLMSKVMTEAAGKEGLLIKVEYPPGSSDVIHRHNAHAFVYVLEGSILMQLKGGKQVTLTPGQTFYEGPNDVHIVGRNASNTQPAKFVVFLVKKNGAPVLVPEK